MFWWVHNVTKFTSTVSLHTLTSTHHMHTHFHPRSTSLHLGCDWHLGGGWLSVTAAVTSDLWWCCSGSGGGGGGWLMLPDVGPLQVFTAVQGRRHGQCPGTTCPSPLFPGELQPWGNKFLPEPEWREATVTALLATVCSHKQAWLCCVFGFIKLGFRGQKTKTHNLSPVVY